MTRNDRAPDLTGDKFGTLTVLERDWDAPPRHAVWFYRCDCGYEGKMRAWRLRNKPHDNCWHVRRVGVSELLEYRCWCRMKERCYQPKNESYSDYGGRGIVVCDRWRDDFAAFYADMGPKPSAAHSIERKDVNGNYDPVNCKWATATEQRRNMRTTVYLEIDGRLVKLVDLAEQLGISRGVVYGRIKNGWSVEDAISVPVRLHQKRKP